MVRAVHLGTHHAQRAVEALARHQGGRLQSRAVHDPGDRTELPPYPADHLTNLCAVGHVARLVVNAGVDGAQFGAVAVGQPAVGQPHEAGLRVGRREHRVVAPGPPQVLQPVGGELLVVQVHPVLSTGGQYGAAEQDDGDVAGARQCPGAFVGDSAGAAGHDDDVIARELERGVAWVDVERARQDLHDLALLAGVGDLDVGFAAVDQFLEQDPGDGLGGLVRDVDDLRAGLRQFQCQALDKPRGQSAERVDVGGTLQAERRADGGTGEIAAVPASRAELVVERLRGQQVHRELGVDLLCPQPRRVGERGPYRVVRTDRVQVDYRVDDLRSFAEFGQRGGDVVGVVEVRLHAGCVGGAGVECRAGGRQQPYLCAGLVQPLAQGPGDRAVAVGDQYDRLSGQVEVHRSAGVERAADRDGHVALGHPVDVFGYRWWLR